MRSGRLRKWLVMGVAPAAVAMALVPAGEAVAQSGSTGQPAGTGPSVSTAAAVGHQYIVILRNQNSKLNARSAARRNAVRTEQAPVLSQMHSLGAKVVGTTTLVNAVVGTMSLANARTLAGNSAVAEVIPNQIIPGPPSPTAQSAVGQASRDADAAVSRRLCGTASHPQLNPEALYNIDAVHPGADGAGVTVALLADGLNPADPDFQRNPEFASSGSPAGSPVVTEEDFSTDGANAPTAGGEAFLDASSIAAQGNESYDLSQYVSTAHPLPAGCDIKIQGVAPGANVLALKVFAQNNDTTTSGFVQAVNYAVASGAKVINESFSAANFPDLAADAIRMADDAAVAAGVTVVACSYDAGYTNTFSPPATDPNVIGVGASTTFRSYAQDTYGGINVPGANGRFVDNNISSLSSGGVSEAGGTLDLVAPGDLNWALCDSDTTLFADCTNENGAGSPIELTGGTSESSPLTAGAAADVIQAYAQAHGGTDPTPALVKQILMSTATDIYAPATQQGAGLLNVAAAVKLARSIGVGTRTGGLLLSPGQVDVTQHPGATAHRTISVTNTSSHPVRVRLSTRGLTRQVGSQTGSFCLQPGTPTAACPANTGSFAIWSGVTEVYQIEHFTVPRAGRPSRLNFSADYQDTGQTSDLHFALLEPNGTYAGYSLPQGLGDYGNVQVANPPPGRWTAVFFTEQDGATTGGVGTSGTIQWQASTSRYQRGAPVSPSVLYLHPGQTGTASLSLTSPSAAGDTAQSVVVSDGRQQTTIPVVVRTAVATNRGGGRFSGTLTGGNGRADWPAQENDYVFDVPRGTRSLRAEVTLSSDPGDLVTAQLIDPQGQNLGYSTNVTVSGTGTPESTLSVDAYHVNPQPGQWTLILAWANPVSGLELSEPFSGTIAFNAVRVGSDLPQHATLTEGKTYSYTVTVHNSGKAPEAYFVDPRLQSDETLPLVNINSDVNASSLSLPRPASVDGGYPFPYYFVPTETSQLQANLSGSVPVDFDTEYFPGDPDIEGSQSGDSASATIADQEVSPGLWLINPDETGPYPATGAPAATASASMSAVTRAFDPAVTSSTGDLWSAFNGVTSGFTPVYVPAGGSATITVKITPNGAAGSSQSGTLFVDDVTLAGLNGIFDLPSGDEIAAIPYGYRVSG
jgi:Subtilase family